MISMRLSECFAGEIIGKLICNYVLYLYHSIIVSIRFGFCVIRFPIIFVII